MRTAYAVVPTSRKALDSVQIEEAMALRYRNRLYAHGGIPCGRSHGGGGLGESKLL